MTTGITRDEALAQEIINILFCKILDEQETAPDETVTFRAGVGEDAGGGSSSGSATCSSG